MSNPQIDNRYGLPLKNFKGPGCGVQRLSEIGCVQACRFGLMSGYVLSNTSS
jgi:hypothetical protein